MAREVKPCGTTAAYQRHLRNKEQPCEACTEAWRSQKREKDEARRARDIETAKAVAVSRDADRLEVLREVLVTLRQHMREAPPQSVAAIAKQVRETVAEIEKLTSAKPSAENAGGASNDLDARRAQRAARRSATAQA